MRFMREYGVMFHEMLGSEGPPLWHWRLAAITLLRAKLPQDKPNHFKWKDFWMTHKEIDDAATQATYQYAMERLGYDS